MSGANRFRVAKIVSLLTNPALLVSATVVTVVKYYADSPEEFWRGSLVGIVLLVLPGLLYSIAIWRQEGYIDFDLSERRDRIVPLMLSSLGAIVGAYLVQTNLSNQVFAQLSFILVAMLVALTVVTSVWKISLHVASGAALVSLLVIFRGESFLAGYFLLPPIIWARLTLQQHTPSQLICGGALGTTLTFVAAWFFRR